MIISPLRYPGGKAKLFPFFADLIVTNGLLGAEYAEPYAGGAGLAIKLLTEGFVDRISLNDLDPALFAFWSAALYQTEEFCRLLEATEITMEEWYRQRDIWRAGNQNDELALGFATFFLNRTNRSGIIDGAGPIGGYKQESKWTLSARLVKSKQIANLRSLARFNSQIDVTCRDALDFTCLKMCRRGCLIYLDPPYYIKGQKLYKNAYKAEDHAAIAAELTKWRGSNWVVSYDDVPPIRSLYGNFAPMSYRLNYSAGRAALGTEVLYLSDNLVAPEVLRFPNAA